MGLDDPLEITNGRLGKPLAAYLYFRLLYSQGGNMSSTGFGECELYNGGTRWSPNNLTSGSGGGFTVTDSGQFGSYPGWKLFDGAVDTQPVAQTQNINGFWIKIQASQVKILTKYRVYVSTGLRNYMTKGWSLQASNTGAFAGEEVTLHTVSDLDWSIDTYKEWSL